MTRILLSFLLALRCYAPSPLFLLQNGATTSSFNPNNYGLTAGGWWAPYKETGFADNDAIGTAVDFSGSSRNATQATVAARPTYKTGVSGVSRPVAYFDAGDFLATPGITQSQPITLVVVARASSLLANTTPFGVEGRYVGIAARTTGQWLIYTHTAGFVAAGPTTNWCAVVAVLNGASSFVYVNGTKTSGSASAEGILPGYSLCLGKWNGENFLGHAGEWIYYPGAMTDSNAAALCAKLQADWGL
jgi:hypothetical protein